MPERHRSSRSRPIDRSVSFAADSTVVDAVSSPEEKGEAANVGMWQIAGAASSNGPFSFSLAFGSRLRAEVERRLEREVEQEKEGRAVWRKRAVGNGGRAAEGGGPQDEVEGRRRVICDSKRAIHLATCQHSIVGICL